MQEFLTKMKTSVGADSDGDMKRSKMSKVDDLSVERVKENTLHGGKSGVVGNGDQRSDDIRLGDMARAALDNISNAAGATFNFHFHQHHQ